MGTGTVSYTKPGIISYVKPGQLYKGSSYSEYHESWWSWALSSPTKNNPVADEIGVSWGTNQHDPGLWFLAQTFGGSTIRGKGNPIQIPPTKDAFFMPVFTCCSMEAEGHGSSWAALASSAKADVDQAVGQFGKLILKVDDQDVVKAPLTLNDFRVQTALFNLDVQPGNPLGIPPGTTKAVADGIAVIIGDLTKGTHQIYAKGSSPAFTAETTYYIELLGDCKSLSVQY